MVTSNKGIRIGGMIHVDVGAWTTCGSDAIYDGTKNEAITYLSPLVRKREGDGEERDRER
jgi:hypothetical protein